MQNWKKLGKLFEPSGKTWWMQSHAMMPTVVQEKDYIFKIFFSPRDSLNRSRGACILLDMENYNTYNLSPNPIIDIGPQGRFDDAGVMPTCYLEWGGSMYITYNGWSLGKSVPFYSFNAIGEYYNGKVDQSSFPNLINRSEINPFSSFAPFILNDGGILRMWYVSLVKWEGDKHFYHIKYAESKDLIEWMFFEEPCIDFVNREEYAIARPVLLKHNNKYRMWFSSRELNGEKTYRIRYAESEDGIKWERLEDPKLQLGKEGRWDSEMICYGYVFIYNKDLYMVYNGNSYGKTGFGLAKLEH